MCAADTKPPAAAVVSCAGLELGRQERAFFVEARPLGFIIFARNIDNPDQVRRLIADFRDAVGREDAPVMVDQEGGRVARLKPPHWPAYPPARVYGDLWRRDGAAGCEAARLGARLIAHDLAELGFNVDCAPVLDVPAPGGHEIIGDRAYGETAEIVATLGRQVCDGLLEGGVMPVIKHVPGHGRAGADSHLELPAVDAPLGELQAVDFAPFSALNDMPAAMTAHVLYRAVDADAPATTSRTVVEEVIRGEIGFDGLLFSDDVSMQALSGTLAERTAAAISAGCDVALYCAGKLDEAREVVVAAGPMSDEAVRRWEEARALLKPPSDFDVSRARMRFRDLLALAAA